MERRDRSRGLSRSRSRSPRSRRVHTQSPSRSPSGSDFKEASTNTKGQSSHRSSALRGRSRSRSYSEGSHSSSGSVAAAGTHKTHQDADESGGSPATLHIAGLTRNVSSAHLAEIVGFFATVLRADLMMDDATGLSRGFAHVKVANKTQARAALEHLNGGNIDGCNIKVSLLLVQPASDPSRRRGRSRSRSRTPPSDHRRGGGGRGFDRRMEQQQQPHRYSRGFRAEDRGAPPPQRRWEAPPNGGRGCSPPRYNRRFADGAPPRGNYRDDRGAGGDGLRWQREERTRRFNDSPPRGRRSGTPPTRGPSSAAAAQAGSSRPVYAPATSR